MPFAAAAHCELSQKERVAITCSRNTSRTKSPIATLLPYPSGLGVKACTICTEL